MAILQADETVERVERMTKRQYGDVLVPWWSPELAARTVLAEAEPCEPGWSLRDGVWSPPALPELEPAPVDVDDQVDQGAAAASAEPENGGAPRNAGEAAILDDVDEPAADEPDETEVTTGEQLAPPSTRRGRRHR